MTPRSCCDLFVCRRDCFSLGVSEIVTGIVVLPVEVSEFWLPGTLRDGMGVCGTALGVICIATCCASLGDGAGVICGARTPGNLLCSSTVCLKMFAKFFNAAPVPLGSSANGAPGAGFCSASISLFAALRALSFAAVWGN